VDTSGGYQGHCGQDGKSTTQPWTDKSYPVDVETAEYIIETDIKQILAAWLYQQ